MLENYLKRLDNLKETRALEVYTNTDEQNNFIDSEIEKTAVRYKTEIIRSFHDFTGVPDDLVSRIMDISKKGKEIPKGAVTVPSEAGVKAANCPFALMLYCDTPPLLVLYKYVPVLSITISLALAPARAIVG